MNFLKRLYRPVGLGELELILDSKLQSFPPRLHWQPIFYPVLNFAYASQIAEKWNVHDSFSGYAGFVTRFDIDFNYVSQFEVQNVGGFEHDELWIPAEELNNFNRHIIGEIAIVAASYGDQYEGERIELTA